MNILQNIYKNLYRLAIENKYGIEWFLAIVVTIAIVLSYQFNYFERMDLMSLDHRFYLRHIIKKDPSIVFIDMAEDSINAIGRWPWPRKWHSTMVKILEEYKAKAVVFDVIFSEPQDDIDDASFEEAIKSNGNVYMPSIYDIDSIPNQALYLGQGVTTIHEPMERFRFDLKGSGHINALPDSDGILRRVPAVIMLYNKITYQLGIVVAANVLGAKMEDVVFDPAAHNIRMTTPSGKNIVVPLDRKNYLIINWVGRWGKDFKHYSFIDVIKSYSLIKKGKKPIIDLDVFKNKICIIGLTAAGLIDIKPIPIQSAYPAVGTNAMVINSVLNDCYVRDAPRWVNILILSLLSIAMTLALCNLRFLTGIFLVIAVVIAYLLISGMLFVFFNIIIIGAYPVLAVIFSYIVTASYTQILQTIEKAQLFNQATRDGLTQLFNIRHFNMLFESEFKNVSFLKFKKLSLVMADIDNFKEANDTYGHQAGDFILKEISYILRSKCRQYDVVARYGGEEFIILLIGTKSEDAVNIAEKIRLSVEAKKFHFGKDAYSTSLSFGIAEYSDESTKSELIEKADKALYCAKKTGKNKVIVYSESLEGEGCK